MRGGFMNVYDFAMKMELDGKAYYEKMAQGSRYPSLKTIFGMLAEEEQKHYDLFAALKAGASPGVAESVVLDKTKSIFNDIIAEKEYEKHATVMNDVEIEAYQQAMTIEDESVRFYTGAASKEQDPGVKEILLKVAREEQKHYNIVENIHDFVLRPHYFLQWREFTNLTELM